jgi:carboxymethylenebutenolidase
MMERQLNIGPPDGETPTFITHPERGGPRPVILFLMDAQGIREGMRYMARRLSSVGLRLLRSTKTRRPRSIGLRTIFPIRQAKYLTLRL